MLHLTKWMNRERLGWSVFHSSQVHLCRKSICFYNKQTASSFFCFSRHLCLHHHCQLDNLHRQYNVHADHNDENETIFWPIQSCTPTLLNQVICKVSCNIVCNFYFCNLQNCRTWKINRVSVCVICSILNRTNNTANFFCKNLLLISSQGLKLKEIYTKCVQHNHQIQFCAAFEMKL